MTDNAECPKWCVTEPEELEDASHIHRTQRTEVDRFKAGTYASISTRGGSFGASRENEIVVHAWHQTLDASPVSGDLYVPAKDAPALAGVFEALSYVTPGQIRELAARVRQAAAEMEPEAGS